MKRSKDQKHNHTLRCKDSVWKSACDGAIETNRSITGYIENAVIEQRKRDARSSEQ